MKHSKRATKWSKNKSINNRFLNAASEPFKSFNEYTLSVGATKEKREKYSVRPWKTIDEKGYVLVKRVRLEKNVKLPNFKKNIDEKVSINKGYVFVKHGDKIKYVSKEELKTNAKNVKKTLEAEHKEHITDEDGTNPVCEGWEDLKRQADQQRFEAEKDGWVWV
jgi:hypothetical protein